MNCEETGEAIKVMQAFVDGAEIECRKNGSQRSWESTWGDTPCWDFSSITYRAKPKPREFTLYPLINDEWGVSQKPENAWSGEIKVREIE